MKTIIFTLVLLVTTATAYSQGYEMQAGIRSGVSSGLTLRVLTGADSWSEAMLLNRNHGVQLYVLKGQNFPFPSIPLANISLSVAWGGHIGSTASVCNYWHEGFERYRSVPVLGADFLLSANYTLKCFPLSVSLDYKPFAELVPDRIMRINLWDFGCTIRYQFTLKK